MPAIEVALDSGMPRPLDYSADESVKAGMRVLVSLRGKPVKGTVLKVKEKSEAPRLVPVKEILTEDPLLPPDLLELAHWMSNYYATPLGKVLKNLLPGGIRKETKAKSALYVLPLLSGPKMKELCASLRAKAPAQAEILDHLLAAPKGIFLSDLLKVAGQSQSSVKALEKKKALAIQEREIDRSALLDREFFAVKEKPLNEEQTKAFDAIKKAIEQKTFSSHLLHGITGSGKTEVYLRAMQEALNQKRSVLYLVPEISLTSQTVERIKGRFSEKIALLHHRLSEGEKIDAWKRIQEGKVPIVLGARSAIFSPLPNLGLIIVDEEHESAYKQSDLSPKYHCRDVAIVRAKLAGACALLGSATPSLESYTNGVKGKYRLHTLTKRAAKSQLPKVQIIDMEREFARNGGFTLFSEALIDGIKKRLNLGEQTLLFLNRRGYHTAAQCPKCEEAICCPHCAITLTFHKGEKMLACHLCDHQIPPPRQCPKCAYEGELKFRGAGTELVQKSLHALFPDLRTLRLDADTTKKKGSHEEIFQKFRSGKADVLIGTQMIAKGHDFPQVTLVGVLGADGGLHIPDFRAGEHTFQLITQVAGRAGRGEIHGEVVIQTRLKDHPIIAWAASADFTSFYQDEIETRKLCDFPPFSRLIKCHFAGENEVFVKREGEKARTRLIAVLSKETEILPLIPCGHAKIKGLFRYQFLIRTKKISEVTPHLSFLSESSGKIKTGVDIDPVSTFF